MTSIRLFLIYIVINIIASGVLAMENKTQIIPCPEKYERLAGKFLLSNETIINGKSDELQSYLIYKIKEFTGLNLTSNLNTGFQNELIFKIDSSLNRSDKEFYKLNISRHKIIIIASDEEGIFRGMQTFFQLIPPSVKSLKNGSALEIPCCKISDWPEFKWRGLNLDCARHFMTKSFLKRYIDILAYYKFNVFHWHLTDDQGWRIEIKKYPKLTSIGAWRKEADGSTYGGFYTQDDINEIVAYAKSRFITVVPEIEMPGHCLSSLAAYPENSCTGGPFQVPNTWGVFDDVYCPGKDSTFYFIENILNEVVNLFPGKYIHIGGDEVPKDRWKACPNCNARIKAEGLKNEEELQSYFVNRISDYLATKGKQIIGWDEILQGGLAPGAIVESWQSMQGAVESASLKHYTVCSPASYTYLSSEVESLDLRKAYSFNPIPEDLAAGERKYILGGEASLWTEETPQNEVDIKLFPRLLALAEVFWSNPQNRDYGEFRSRLQRAYADLKTLGIQYGLESKAISFQTSYNELKKEFTVTVIPGQKEIELRYTEDGIEPVIKNGMPDSSAAVYNKPLKIKKNIILKIAAFANGRSTGDKLKLSFDFHKAINAKLILINKYSDQYIACGKNSLIDGLRGSNDFHDGLWQGYDGVDFNGIIDLGKEKEISKVIPRFMLNSKAWIFLPTEVMVSLSRDGVTYFDEKIIKNNVPQNDTDIVMKDFRADFNNERARYIKVIAKSIKKCPSWHPGAGQNAWMFSDEIEVE